LGKVLVKKRDKANFLPGFSPLELNNSGFLPALLPFLPGGFKKR